MVNLEEIRDRCKEIGDEIERLLIETGFREYGEICIVGPGESIESRTMYHMLQKYLQDMDVALIYLEQVCAKEVEHGVVRKAADGSYIFQGKELEAGDYIQIFDKDEQVWHLVLIEDCFLPEGPRYVLHGMKDVSLDGLEIRHAGEYCLQEIDLEDKLC